MLPIEPLGLSANQWKFLSAPDRYVEASSNKDRKLALESTRRQFLTARDILARLNGSHGEKAVRGLLLADDVGLGKTTVAALVAWVVAAAGEKRGVRILAPNEIMKRRWKTELEWHVEPLKKCAPALDVRKSWVKAEKVRRLSAGSIQVVTHSYTASNSRLNCDLLIVDEAHRAKGERTAFSAALKRQKKHARRVLILTATPFSIRLVELKRMLTLIGGEAAHEPVARFSRALDGLYAGNPARSAEAVAKRLASRAVDAVEALRPFVIRRGIDDLKAEQSAFGHREDWNIDVPPAKLEELELMLRMDRALRVARAEYLTSSKVTNDPRFHVGWRHFDAERQRLREASQLAGTAKAVVENQLKSIERLRKTVGIHSKMQAVAVVVKSTIEQGEKVILFCHHHATAQELTAYVHTVLLEMKMPPSPWAAPVWKLAWNEAIKSMDHKCSDETLRDAFVDWLCTDAIRAQTWSYRASAH